MWAHSHYTISILVLSPSATSYCIYCLISSTARTERDSARTECARFSLHIMIHGIRYGFLYSAMDHNPTSAAPLGTMVGELCPGASPNGLSARYSIYTLARRQYDILDQYRYPLALYW